jgi:hypothetical protein
MVNCVHRLYGASDEKICFGDADLGVRSPVWHLDLIRRGDFML